MTRKTFYAKLRSVKNKFRWTNKDGGLRGYSKKKNITEEFCPLTAVNFALNGEVLDVGEYQKAAEKLGIGDADMEFIVHIADDTVNELDGAEITARQCLLKNVGLKPEKRERYVSKLVTKSECDSFYHNYWF